MFEESDTGFSFGSCLVQILFAYFVPPVLLGLIEAQLNFQDSIASQITRYVLILCISGGSASLVSAIARNSAREGRWVWVLPFSFWAYACASDYFRFGLKELRLMFFFGPGPGSGEEAWGVFLFTLPTWSCCCYAVAMWWRHRHIRGGNPELASNRPGDDPLSEFSRQSAPDD